jgi:hypothetical protein
MKPMLFISAHTVAILDKLIVKTKFGSTTFSRVTLRRTTLSNKVNKLHCLAKGTYTGITLLAVSFSKVSFC